MSMRKNIFLLIGLIIAVLGIIYTLNTTASNFQADFGIFTTEELDWMAEHPVIKYAPDIDFFPYEYIDEGTFKGLSLDYIEWIEKNYNLNFEIVPYDTWDDILAALEKEEIDLITSTARSSQRETFISFSASYVTMDYVAFIRNDTDDSFFEYDLMNMRTAVIKNYITQDILEERQPGIDLILVENSNDGFEMLSNGEIDVFIASSGQALKAFNDLHIDNIKVNENIRLLSSVPLHMGTYKGNDPLASILTKILSTMPDTEKTRIFDNWMHIDFTETLTPELYRRVLTGALFITLAILAIFLWNQLLSHQVNMKSKEIEKELHQRTVLENRLKNIINAIPSPIYVKNARGVFLHVNQAFCKIIGVDNPSDIEFKENISSGVLTEASREHFNDMEGYVMRSHVNYQDKKNTIHFNDGQTMTLNSIKLPFKIIGNATDGILSIDVDITEREMTKAKLSEANAKLERMVKERSEDITKLNEELTDAMEKIKSNEQALQNANEELTALLSTLQSTQNELIEKETLGAQGQKLSQISKQMSRPIEMSLEKSNYIRQVAARLTADMSQQSAGPKDIQEELLAIESALESISKWLMESSRIVDTFKLISLVDHGLQPTRINLKLMLESCCKQALDDRYSLSIHCSSHIYLLASPNAIHQIMLHLIGYTASLSQDPTSPAKTEMTIDTDLDDDSFTLKFIRSVEAERLTSDDLFSDLGLQIIESIINHYFSGQLKLSINGDTASLEMKIPRLFLIDEGQQKGEMDNA